MIRSHLQSVYVCVFVCVCVLPVIHRMDDKGEVKCIKFSIGNKILAVQRTSKSVVSQEHKINSVNTSGIWSFSV